MKNIFLFLTILMFSAIMGCRKEIRQATHDSQTLSGSWELRTSYGNRMPEMSYEPGNGNIFVFSNATYSQLSPDVSTKNGTCKLTKAPNPNTGENMSAVEFEGNSLGTVCYSIKGNVLTFYWSPLASCGSMSIYARMADITSTSNKP